MEDQEEAMQACRSAVRGCMTSLQYAAPEAIPLHLGKLTERVIAITERYMTPQFEALREQTARQAFMQGVATAGSIDEPDALQAEEQFSLWWRSIIALPSEEAGEAIDDLNRKEEDHD